VILHLILTYLPLGIALTFGLAWWLRRRFSGHDRGNGPPGQD